VAGLLTEPPWLGQETGHSHPGLLRGYVAAIVEVHPAHALALPWLQRVKDETDSGLVAAHSLAELYAVLTTLSYRPRILPATARQLIERNVVETCEVVFLSAKDYVALLARLPDLGIIGGATYDALLLHAARKANVDRVITLNAKDFRRIYPDLAGKIISPLEEVAGV